jgi:hypothetical protein
VGASEAAKCGSTAPLATVQKPRQMDPEFSMKIVIAFINLITGIATQQPGSKLNT